MLADFCETVRIRPVVNQVELHPFFQQAEGRHGIFNHPVLMEIGRQYGKTAAQVVLRWNVQRGVTVIPRSVHPARMAEDMARMDALDAGCSEMVDHFSPAFVRMLHGMRLHD